MKKALILSAGIAACLTFSSCFKVWNCDCTVTYTYDSTFSGSKEEIGDIHMTFPDTKKNAKKECQRTEDDNTRSAKGVTQIADCKLK